MKTYLPLAIMLLAGCGDRGDVVHADSLELIRIDADSQTLDLTVVSADGKRTTIVFTPAAAVQAQEAMARTMLLTLEDASAAPRSPPLAR